MKRSLTSVLGFVFSCFLLGAAADAQKFDAAGHRLVDDNDEQRDTDHRCKETFTSIDFPGASSTVPFGINPRGDIVGHYVSAGVTHGFLLSGDEFTSIDFPGASLTIASGINARGDIVGQYDSAGVTHGFLL